MRFYSIFRMDYKYHNYGVSTARRAREIFEAKLMGSEKWVRRQFVRGPDSGLRETCANDKNRSAIPTTQGLTESLRKPVKRQ